MTIPVGDDVDLERLGKVVSRIRSGSRFRDRAEGWTTGYVYLMIGEAALGDNDNHYLYVGETVLAAEQAMFDFIQVHIHFFGDHKLTIHRPSHRIKSLVANNTFNFIGVSPFIDGYYYSRIFQGTKFDKVFLDVDTTWLTLIQRDKLSYARHVITARNDQVEIL